MKPALLVIDVQKHYIYATPERTKSINDAMVNINTAIDLFRKNNLPVICIQHINEAQGAVPSAAGFDLADELKIIAEDIHIHKTYGNAFNKTKLEQKLKELGCDTVILTGFCAENCVLSTCRGAMDKDIFPIILRGGIASGVFENVKFVENVNELISLGALKQLIK